MFKRIYYFQYWLTAAYYHKLDTTDVDVLCIANQYLSRFLACRYLEINTSFSND